MFLTPAHKQSLRVALFLSKLQTTKSHTFVSVLAFADWCPTFKTSTQPSALFRETPELSSFE